MFFIAGYIRAQQDTDLIGFELSVVVGFFQQYHDGSFLDSSAGLTSAVNYRVSCPD